MRLMPLLVCSEHNHAAFFTLTSSETPTEILIAYERKAYDNIVVYLPRLSEFHYSDSEKILHPEA